jgi:hypothetical protein
MPLFAIDTNQAFQLHIQVCFLLDLAQGGILDLFSSIYIPAKKAPHTLSGIDSAPAKQKFPFMQHHDYGH